jgi:hypothetical protein
LPDIKRKIPTTAGNTILQQDGGKSHLQDNDEVFKAKVMELHGDQNVVKLNTQPTHPPDLNMNDLGFFSSLQSKYYMTSPKDSIELIEMVEEAFKKYPLEKLSRIA